MKKVIGLFVAVLFFIGISANSGCFYNMTSGYCCENGEMYCAPEGGVNCDGTSEIQLNIN